MTPGSLIVMDLLRWPIVRGWARHRHARLLLQLPLLVAAAAIVAHGLAGPSIAPRNLATVATWVHYRGLLVVALLAIGNVFCAGCPMIAVRDAGRRLAHPAWRWPRALRSKWPAIVLFVAVLYTYERFDLWSLPAATAWLVLAYFAAAAVVDVLFAGATFCKYVCPIGQFSFLASTLSPTELQVRDAATCRTCRTADCITGRHAAAAPLAWVPGAPAAAPAPARRPALLARGCELGLFLPSKVGNMDCTLCLDCVRACPHDNIALVARTPAAELTDRRRRSGIGRLERRLDIAALVVVFTFGSIVNAFAMTAPAVRMERWIAAVTGSTSETLPLGTIFVLGLGVLPLALAGVAWGVTRVHGGRSSAPFLAAARRLVYALVPVGLGIWVAHYAFHFLTGLLTLVPVTQSAFLDLTGTAALGAPQWTWVGVRPGLVFPIQFGCVMLGAIGSLASIWRLSSDGTRKGRDAAGTAWGAVVLILAALSVWVLSQPMDMRGIGLPG